MLIQSLTRRPGLGLLLVAAWAAGIVPGSAAEPTAKDLVFFEKQVRPLLVERCFECHTGDDSENGLRLDSLAGMLTGGLRGAAVVPGNPDQSLLVTAIRHNEELKMPPKRKLPTRERAVLTEWVKRGAVWPNARPTPKTSTPLTGAPPPFTDAQKSFWAFQPPRDVSPPVVDSPGRVRTPVDRFILARLEAAGLSAAPPADRHTWLRRVTLDLTGLLPTSDDNDRFVEDTAPGASARIVDRLLASPGYGERWGRHWLDVARYADSNGLDENLCYANAFRYRDYVIAAFNADKPFDRFTREQIAGDLLPASNDPLEDLDRIIATGFLVLGPKMLAEDDPRKMEMDIIDEQIDTVGRTFMGLTLGCARCHDHKFDPISQQDYYGLAGVFKSTRTMENFKVVAKWSERPLADPETISRQKQHQVRVASAREAIEKVMADARREVLDRGRRLAGAYLAAAGAERLRNRLLSDIKPLGNDPAIADRPGVVLREAESFDRGNALKDTTSYGKGIGVILNAGKLPNTAEYDITLKQAATCRIEFRLAAAENRPVRLLVNGALVRPRALDLKTGSWYPDTQRWSVAAITSLKAGRNTIRIDCKGPFPHIDKLLVAPVADDGNDRIGELARAAERLAGDKSLSASLTHQWVAFLNRTAGDTNSPLAYWHAAMKSTAALPAGPSGSTFAGFKPGSLTEIVDRYATMFRQVDDAWRALLKNKSGKAPTALPDADRESLRRLLYADDGPFKATKELDANLPPAIAEGLKKQRVELKKLEASLPRLPMALAVIDGKIEDLRVHIRGSYLSLGVEAPRRFPRIVSGPQQAPLGKSQSGRRELADWLTRPDHPLVARVLVNRLWRWHFGHGLVRSPDNFGRLGQRPTHPQLLDWLARQLVRRGWSIKAIHRVIVLSATYRMSSTYDPRAMAADPQNKLQWRFDRRRLSAEELRDAIYQVAGTLDRTMGGTLLSVKNRGYVTSTGSNMKSDVYRNPRRSVYQPVIRSALFDVFQSFDFADPSMPNGDRVTTTVAPQALFLMNSRLVAEQSLAAGRRVQRAGDDPASRVAAAYRLCYGRRPTDPESDAAVAFVARYRSAAAGVDTAKKDSPSPDDRSWQALCRVLMAATEFVYCE